MHSFMDGTCTLIRQVVNNVKAEILTAQQSCDGENEVMEDIFESTCDPFLGIDADALLSKYIKENFNYAEHKEILLGTKLSRSPR